jgi:hypothetical protein
MFCVVLVFYGIVGHCIHTTATKGEIDLKRILEFLPVRSAQLSALNSNPRGKIDRTPRRPASHALPTIEHIHSCAQAQWLRRAHPYDLAAFQFSINKTLV